MIRAALMLALAGCWTDAPSPLTNVATRAASPGSFPVPARDLADPHLHDQLDHHAWITHLGRAWIRRDEPMQGRHDPLRQPKLFAVIDRRPDAVRVVSDDDDARIAVWTELADIDLTLIAPVEVSDDRGTVDPAHGVWLDPGVTIAVGAPQRGQRTRAIRLIDPVLRVTGFAAADALGPVWIGPVPRTTGARASPEQITPGAPILAGPRPDERVLAEVIEQVDATATPAAAGWQEVDVHVRGIHVRGFVRATALVDDYLVRMGAGEGTAYGISDTERMIVDAGACLYDRKGGEVIGVSTATRERYAFHVGEAWPSVYVGTPWDNAVVTVHDLAPGASLPRLESCAR